MSKKITGLDSYHSQYPMSYYEEGVAYAFYHHEGIVVVEVPATEEQMAKGADMLANARDSFGFEQDEKIKAVKFVREIGVVVGKKAATESNPDEIIVLFEKDGKYFTRLYAVNTKPVYLNDKEWGMATPGKNLSPVADGGTTGPVKDDVTGPVKDEATGPVKKK